MFLLSCLIAPDKKVNRTNSTGIINRQDKINRRKMRPFTYKFLLSIVILSCHKKASIQTFASTPDAPFCIQNKIDSIKNLPVANPPIEIDEYLYKERKAFVISARCCDFYTIAVDSSCNYICAPSGGFTGKGDRKCSDFTENAKFIRLVWKDDRKNN